MIVHVAQVIARLNVGGPAALVLGLAEKAPCDMEVYAGQVQGGEAEHQRLTEVGASVISVPGLGRSVRPLDDFRAGTSLYRLLRERRPDIVHTHTAKAGALGRSAAIAARVPRRVHTFHGHLLYGYFGPVARAAVVAAERELARVTDRIVAVGHRVRDDLVNAGIGRYEQYEVIVPGVTLPSLQVSRHEARRLLALPEDRPVIGFIGRLIHIKRPDRLLQLARSLPDVLVIIAGEGPLLPQMEAEAPTNVRLLGWRSDAHVVHAACDVAVLTSDNEGMPLTLIEAALCGVPAVATDVGSTAEVVADELTGLVVDASSDSIVAAVDRLLRDDDLRQRLGVAARLRATAEFGLERMVDAHARLYQKLLDEKPSFPGTR